MSCLMGWPGVFLDEIRYQPRCRTWLNNLYSDASCSNLHSPPYNNKTYVYFWFADFWRLSKGFPSSLAYQLEFQMHIWRPVIHYHKINPTKMTDWYTLMRKTWSRTILCIDFYINMAHCPFQHKLMVFIKFKIQFHFQFYPSNDVKQKKAWQWDLKRGLLDTGMILGWF